MEKEQRKRRLEELLGKRKKKEDEIESELRVVEMLELFPKKAEVEILDRGKINEVETEMTETFPFAYYGRVDWDKLSNRIAISNEEIPNIPDILSKQGLNNTLPVYLIVGIHGYPVAKSTLSPILDRIEEIKFWGQDQYIFCPLSKYVIEFSRYDEITMGWL